MNIAKPIVTAFAALVLLPAAAVAQNEESGIDAAELEALKSELAEARTQLAESARRMAEIQRKLVAEPAMAELQALEALDGIDVEHIRIESGEALKELTDMPPRLGVLLESGDEDATRVIGITPGSGADRAGIRSGDVIVSVAGADVEGKGGQAIQQALADIEAGETVEVVVRRGPNGEEERAFGVETTSVRGDISMVFERFDEMPEIAERIRVIGLQPAGAPELPRMPLVPGFSVLGPDTDLIRNHPGLESYFGTGNGVIVLRIDADNPMQLIDGDVILTLDREAVESPVDLARMLMQREPGASVALEVMRNGVLTEVGGVIPERTGPFGHRLPFKLRLPDPPKSPFDPAHPAAGY